MATFPSFSKSLWIIEKVLESGYEKEYHLWVRSLAVSLEDQKQRESRTNTHRE